MNTFQEINLLRKEGKLDAAFLLAEESLTTAQDDPWMKRAMGWVIYEYLNKYASERNFSQYLDWMKKLTEIQIDANETMLMDSVLWSVRKLLSEAEGVEEQYNDMLSLLRLLPISHTGVPYSALLSSVVKLDGKWKDILSFFQWWNMDNLQPEDFSEVKQNNGRKLMSLAERALICYSKHLLVEGTAEMAESFIPFLQRVVEEHKEYVYPPYYLARLMMKRGDMASAFDLLKKFAQNKAKEFWVWQLLAETQNNDDVRLSFLCKALMCGGKEEMLVSLREDAAKLLSKLGFYKEGKLEATKAIETRKSNNWKISNDLQNIQTSTWFKQTESNIDNFAFYKDHLGKAECLVMGEAPTYTCMVTYVNETKKMVSFVTEDKKQGFFKMPKGICRLKRNCMITLTANDICEDKPTVVRKVSAIDGFENNAFYKPFSGKFHNKGSFGLVGCTYIESNLMKSLKEGSMVSGVACISFDKKKGKWGWRAIEINE